eukprot:GHVH01012806.1.p1 GENE.GHVH01012806.1~~GHVH01012806.1.p1  ORF type:complete len:454 (+),score=44.30 GHVH01012806.1:356-1717(+)
MNLFGRADISDPGGFHIPDEPSSSGGTSMLKLNNSGSAHFVPTYEPSSAVTMMWTAFGVQCIATLYILSRSVILPEHARKFHHIFGFIGITASIAYLLEAGALEYIDLLHDRQFSANLHASPWRLPCNNSNLDGSDNSTDTPTCTIIPYYISRIIIQSLMVHGIAFLAGAPRKEQGAAITCVALMESCNFFATLFKSLYERITIIMIWAFSLRMFFMIPLIYFLLYGIDHYIRRAPPRVRGVCHGWCFVMVVLQIINVVLWCLAYGSGLFSFVTLLGCRVICDMINTVAIPLLVLCDVHLLMLVRDREQRFSALNLMVQNGMKHNDGYNSDAVGVPAVHHTANNNLSLMNATRNLQYQQLEPWSPLHQGMNYRDRVMMDVDQSGDTSYPYESDGDGRIGSTLEHSLLNDSNFGSTNKAKLRDHRNETRDNRSFSKGSTTTAKSLNDDTAMMIV